MAHIVLDFTIEADDDRGWKEAGEVMQEHNLSYEILEEEGPGGGWPQVEVVGKADDIKRWLVTYCRGDEDQAFDYEDLIED